MLERVPTHSLRQVTLFTIFKIDSVLLWPA
uniref:Uncharacterized protein n=1 Tax=Anguilla anguilla TaxID=7936 RepID=A0A0E9RPE2_ANGAN